MPRSSVHRDLPLPLRNTIFPTLKTCNTPTLKRAVIHGNKFPVIQYRLISASNHGLYNKSNTCRLCSYNHLPILPPRRHPCQVNKILLLHGEGDDRFPISQSIHIHTPYHYTGSFLVPVHNFTTLVVLCASPITTLAVSCASPFNTLLFQSSITHWQ